MQPAKRCKRVDGVLWRRFECDRCKRVAWDLKSADHLVARNASTSASDTSDLY